MRLSVETQKAIQQAAEKTLTSLKTWKIWLYGSRANPQKKGGDIDLCIETESIPKNSSTLISKFRTALLKDIGEQKVDIVFLASINPDKLVESLLAEGKVLLCQNRPKP